MSCRVKVDKYIKQKGLWMRDLAYYLNKEKIVNNDVRYIQSQPPLKQELKSLFDWSDTENISELLYLYRNKFTAYPTCGHCQNSLTSKSFVNGVRGYRSWCSKSCYRSSSDCKAQIKKTSQEKYGTDHPFSASVVQVTRKKTNLKKYGVSNPMLWSGDLFKNAMLEHHGVANSRHIVEINERIKTSIKHRNEQLFSKKLVSYLEDLQIKPLAEVDISDRFKVHEFSHSCGNVIKTSVDNLYKVRCFNCHRPKSLSKFQFEVETFVASLGFYIQRNDRKIIAPLELDITVPEKKIAIETHGDYWHTNDYKDDNDHQLKTVLVEKAGWSLLQIFESEWKTKPEIIKSLISAKLGKSTRIFARKLKVIELDQQQEIKLFNSSHLQGYSRSSICLGLTDGVEIYCAMSFGKPRFNKNYDWELIRFANALNYQVVGGASKLMTKFTKQFLGQTLLSYADRRISTGKLYEVLGFKLTGSTKPNYWYINFKKNIKLSRYQAQKNKLSKLLGKDFLEGLNERENMILNGYKVIHDAGNLVFFKQL